MESIENLTYLYIKKLNLNWFQGFKLIRKINLVDSHLSFILSYFEKKTQKLIVFKSDKTLSNFSSIIKNLQILQCIFLKKSL